MNVIVTTAAIVGAGAWLRWATTPVILAYRLGRHAGRIRARAGM